MKFPHTTSVHPVETPTPPRPSQPKIFGQAALKRSHPTTCQEVVATQILRCFLLSWRSLLQETCGSTLPLHLNPQIASKYCWFGCWRSIRLKKYKLLMSHPSIYQNPETNSRVYPWKSMDAWKMFLSFWGVRPIFTTWIALGLAGLLLQFFEAGLLFAIKDGGDRIGLTGLNGRLRLTSRTYSFQLVDISLAGCRMVTLPKL